MKWSIDRCVGRTTMSSAYARVYYNYVTAWPVEAIGQEKERSRHHAVKQVEVNIINSRHVGGLTTTNEALPIERGFATVLRLWLSVEIASQVRCANVTGGGAVACVQKRRAYVSTLEHKRVGVG